LLQVKQPQVRMPELLVKARPRVVLQTLQRAHSPEVPVAQRLVSEEPERQNPRERLAMSLLLAWRSGRQALVSFAPGQPLSIPLPD
jgi:hypothetical protein